MVTSAVQHGEVEFVEIESRRGEPCRLRNPWGVPCRISGTDGTAQELNGAILCFGTEKGKRYRVLPTNGSEPPRRRVSPQAGGDPTSYSLTTATGMIFRGALGRGR